MSTKCFGQGLRNGVRNGVDISFFVDYSKNKGWAVHYENSFNASHSFNS